MTGDWTTSGASTWSSAFSLAGSDLTTNTAWAAAAAEEEEEEVGSGFKDDMAEAATVDWEETRGKIVKVG